MVPWREQSSRLWPALLAAIASLAFAGWAWSRSDSLERATDLAARSAMPESLASVVGLALDHLDRQPWDQRAARLAAVSLSRLDQAAVAEPYYRRAGRLSLEDSRTRAYALARANRRDDAIAAYRAILAVWPDDIPALQMLGGIHYSRKEYDIALELARRLQELPGGEVQGHWRAATILHEIDYREDAAAEFEAVVRLDPELAQIPAEARPWFWFRAADDLLFLGQSDRVRTLLEPVVRQTDDPKLALLLGRAQYQSGALDVAGATWSRVTETHPRNATAWLELGRLRLARGQLPEAVSALERAVELEPRDIEAHYSLRTAYTRTGQGEQADRVSQRLDQLRAGAPPTSGGMGPRRGLPES